MAGDSKVDRVVSINNFAYVDAIKQLFSNANYYSYFLNANFEIIKNDANTTRAVQNYLNNYWNHWSWKEADNTNAGSSRSLTFLP